MRASQLFEVWLRSHVDMPDGDGPGGRDRSSFERAVARCDPAELGSARLADDLPPPEKSSLSDRAAALKAAGGVKLRKLKADAPDKLRTGVAKAGVAALAGLRKTASVSAKASVKAAASVKEVAGDLKAGHAPFGGVASCRSPMISPSSRPPPPPAFRAAVAAAAAAAAVAAAVNSRRAAAAAAATGAARPLP